MTGDDDYQNPVPETTYISPRLADFSDRSRSVRIATRANKQDGGYEYAIEKGEIVIRHKKDAATCIKAKFFEDSKRLMVLSIQKYRTDSNEPYGSGFSFVGDEIRRLIDYLDQLRALDLGDGRAKRLPDEELKQLAVDAKQARSLIENNQHIFAELVRSSITTEDVVAVAYRKKQVETFEKLLKDSSYFESLKNRMNLSAEGIWQRFFERNQWIFGYGLNMVYMSSLDSGKLEQVVAGFDVAGPGKRVDALLKTRGAISNLVFIEIKTHETQLLASKPYRSGCWNASSDLSGGISQVQGTVAEAGMRIQSKLLPRKPDGSPSGEEIYNFQPRGYLVIGSLDEFVESAGVHTEKLRSFELLRRNTLSPEVVTFDELFQRAKFIVETSE